MELKADNFKTNYIKIFQSEQSSRNSKTKRDRQGPYKESPL